MPCAKASSLMLDMYSLVLCEIHLYLFYFLWPFLLILTPISSNTFYKNSWKISIWCAFMALLICAVIIVFILLLYVCSCMQDINTCVHTCLWMCTLEHADVENRGQCQVSFFIVCSWPQIFTEYCVCNFVQIGTPTSQCWDDRNSVNALLLIGAGKLISAYHLSWWALPSLSPLPNTDFSTLVPCFHFI